MSDEARGDAPYGDEPHGDEPEREMPWWGYLVPLILVGFLLFFTLAYWHSRVGNPGPVPPEGSVGSAAETPQAAPPSHPANTAGLIPEPPDSDSTVIGH